MECYQGFQFRSKAKVIKIICVLICFFSMKAYAQTSMDTVQLNKYQSINKKFPLASLIDAQYTFYTPTHINTKLNGKEYLNADMRNQKLLTTTVNTPFLLSKKIMVVNSFRYSYETMSFQNIDTTVYRSIDANIKKIEKNNLYSDALNVIYFGQIFGKKLTCNLSTAVDFSSYGFERIVGNVMVSVGLKQNKRTSIYLGLIGSTNKSMTIPVIPSIAVTHWLDTKWLVDCYVPAYLYLRRVFDDNSRLSFGLNTTNGGQTYVHPEIPSVSSFNFQRGRIELGALYQKAIGGGFILSSKIGYAIRTSDKVMDTNGSSILLKMNQQPNFSLNIGISYNFLPKKYKSKIH